MFEASWRCGAVEVGYVFQGEILSSWEEEGGSVVLMGALVMGFVDVKDLGVALSDTQHHLVCVNFSLMTGNVLCPYKATIVVLIYSPCHKRFAISLVWITRTNVTSLHMLPENRSRRPRTAQPRKIQRGFGRSIEIFRVANDERRFVECGIIFQ